MKLLKKYYLFIILIILTILRFLLSYDLPTYYIRNLGLDDSLMIELANNLSEGLYLGNYSNVTLVKGFIFPLFLCISRLINLSYATSLTILYLLACLTFCHSLKTITSQKTITIIYIFLLFNPLSYSMELFQRLYRNSLSIIELLFFFAFLIYSLNKKKSKKTFFIYLWLGLISSIMLLTREDNIWCIVILIILFIYQFLKDKKLKSFFLHLIPLLIIFLTLNIVSFINYKYYNTYTYNELSNSNFTKAYLNIQAIKEEKKISQVSITKETLKKLASFSKTFNFTEEEIEKFYLELSDKDTNEINNGNIIWYLRNLIYAKERFKSGKEANEYFEKLNKEIEELFKNGELEKEFIIPSVFINTPTLQDIKKIPKNILDIIIYTSSYQNVKTIEKDLLLTIPNIFYDNTNKTYYTYYRDYHNTENMVTKNSLIPEIIRIIYKYFTCILSIPALCIYFYNIKKIKEKKQFLLTLILISYLIILLGVTYTNTTAFYAKRYFYLGNIYILQNLFILLNLERLYYEKFRINNFTSLFKRRKNN